MAEAGINVVRLAKFAWSRLVPSQTVRAQPRRRGAHRAHRRGPVPLLVGEHDGASELTMPPYGVAVRSGDVDDANARTA